MELWEYISGPDLWLGLGKITLKIVVIVLLAMIINQIGKRFIDGIFNSERPSNKRRPLQLSNRREKTLSKLLKNILLYLLTFIVIVMILDTFDVPVSTLLAGAGVAGLAIGFGAQSLVKDMISGFFIVFEDQFSVGDYVDIGGFEGDVEEVGFRTTKIQSWTGEQIIIPNGDISLVTNYSAHNGLAVVEVKVPYESDMNQIEALINEVIIELPNRYDEFVGIPEIAGVTDLDLSNFAIRIVAETAPVMHWSAERIIRKEVKEKLFTHGIDIPSPRIVVYSRDRKEGQNVRKGAN